MRGVWILALVVACTKPNPATKCADGTCSDSRYPFCDVDGAIGGEAGTCIAISCMPGDVAECRTDGALVCNADGNNYDVTACPAGCVDSVGCNKQCTTDDDCSSGFCKSSGICALESEIAFTLPAALPGADCSRANPCTLDDALQRTTPFVLLAEGNYEPVSELTVNGDRRLVGQGPSKTIVRSVQAGRNVFAIGTGAVVQLESMTIRDAVDSSGIGTGGAGVWCPDTPVGPRSLTMIDVVLTNNSLFGAYTQDCDVTIERSSMSSNRYGLRAYNGTLVVDRSTITSNSLGGVDVLGETSLAITNSFVVRNSGLFGVGIGDVTGTLIFDFNTVVDNATCGLQCTSLNGHALKNNLLIRNGSQNVCGDASCTTPGSISASAVTGLNFKQPDSASYDYHLMAGSTALDAALAATLDHDFDGDSRPHGAGWDVGADEL